MFADSQGNYIPESVGVAFIRKKRAGSDQVIKKNIALNTTLSGYTTTWADNFIKIDEKISDKYKNNLIAQGYMPSNERVPSKLINNIIGLAVSSNGRHVVVADYTKIMLITMDQKDSSRSFIYSVAEFPIKEITLFFDYRNSVLFYQANNDPLMQYQLNAPTSSDNPSRVADLLWGYLVYQGIVKPVL